MPDFNMNRLIQSAFSSCINFNFKPLAFFLPDTLQGTGRVIDYGMIKGRFVWIISAALVIGILFILNYNESSLNIFPSYKTSSMKNLYLKHREGNEIKWELSSVTAILPLGKREIFLESLKLKINQTPEIYLSSGSGIYDMDDGNVTLKESVTLNIKDTTFVTDTLEWNSADELITTEDRVKVSGGNFLIQGTGLTAKVKQQQVRIMKDVEATFYH